MTREMSYLSFFFLSFLCLGISQCAYIPLDASVQAAMAGDETIIFQGGDSKSKKGYLFLQQRENTFPVDVISILAPALNCKRDACVRFQFFRKDGTPGFGGSLAKGKTRQDFLLSDILGHTSGVTTADDGEFSAIVQMYFLGPDSQEYSRIMNGFVRLNVLSQGYDPVPCGDPAIAWRVKSADLCEVQFTTAGRTAVCGTGCAP